ncbi:MAG: hypothetical protein ABL982_16720 [Vicinamibacterales bacterium]
MSRKFRLLLAMWFCCAFLVFSEPVASARQCTTTCVYTSTTTCVSGITTTWTCRDVCDCTTVCSQSSIFRFKTGAQFAPISAGTPLATITDGAGAPIIINGITLQLVPNAASTAEATSLFGTLSPSHTWQGFQTNIDLPPASVGSIDFQVTYVWPSGVAPQGAVWFTDNGDDLYASNVTDAFELLGFATPFCFGDGSGAPCPCANNSAVGAQVGCLNSLGTGGQLRALGNGSIAADTVVLAGSMMPSSSALYFQGTSQLAGGAGSAFGDGLRCARGTVIRLGTKSNVAGASQYPVGADLSVSVRGTVSAGDTRSYQVWYRNAAAFCTTSTFNMTNGVLLTWNP